MSSGGRTPLPQSETGIAVGNGNNNSNNNSNNYSNNNNNYSNNNNNNNYNNYSNSSNSSSSSSSSNVIQSASGADAETKKWEDTKQSLRMALAANHELQDKILSELQWIARRKRDNRLEATRSVREFCGTILAGERATRKNAGRDISTSTATATATSTATSTAANTALPTNQYRPDKNLANGETPTRKKTKKNSKENDNYVPSSDEINALLAGDDDCENCKDEKEGINNNNNNNNKWSFYQRKKFRYDPHRKWTLDYFSDPTGSHPKENEDIALRRKLMTRRTPPRSAPRADEGTAPGNFFHHTSQPFTPHERIRLDEWLSSNENDSNNNDRDNEDDSNFNSISISISNSNSNSNSESESFYERIAQKLRKEHHEDEVARKKDKVLLPTCLPRSAEDIRLYHRNRLASQHAFTKEESLAILEGVAETAREAMDVRGNNGEEDAALANGGDCNDEGGKQTKNDDSNQRPPTRRPDWDEICERVRNIHRKSRSDTSPGEPDVNPNVPVVSHKNILITPYRCMVHYKKKLRRRPDGSFTPEEDELLLRYIAAMGPQFIWGITEIADLATRLFPTTHIRRIYERTHCSQWHPLSKDSIWTKEEEQKLVLAMKVYSDVSGESGGDGTLSATNKDVTNDEDDDDDDGAGGERSSDEHQVEEEQSARTALEKKAIRKAATHFHPQRQLYKVVKKWERSFSPRFSYKPFSKEEDLRLLEIVKSSAANTPFSAIAKQHFPNRSSDQLYQRWTKIAPDKDVVEKLVPFMIRSGVKRGLMKVVKPSNGATADERSSGSPNEETGQNDNTAAIFDPNDFVVEVLPNQGQGIESEECLEAISSSGNMDIDETESATNS